MFSSLSTQILPLLVSINSWQSIKPSPVPFSFDVPGRCAFPSILNSDYRIPSFIPIPSSAIQITTLFAFISALISIFSYLVLNFMALLNRFDTTTFIVALSQHILIASGMVMFVLMPLISALPR